MARYLSRAELSCIAGKYIEMYYALFGISKNDPAPINPEQFANSVLGLNLKMLPLCSDGHILGLTVFQRCSFTATLGDGTKLLEVFMPRDIVIDSSLAADRCTGCRNFTIAHETAHQILADQFPNDYGKAANCRGHIAYRERNGQPSWEEWQANTLAAELLMPTFLINPAKADAPPGCGQCNLRYGCRIVRLGDSRERKKRPHLVKKLNHKSIKEGIQMKQNRIFDQNSSQKARSWHYNMDTNRAEAQFADGSAIAIDCLAIEDEYGNTPAQRAELDWLLYNKPLECVQLVLSGEIEHYLSLGCDHGKLKD